MMRKEDRATNGPCAAWVATIAIVTLLLVTTAAPAPAGAIVMPEAQHSDPLAAALRGSPWPATVVLKRGQGRCTATVIGPRTALTAATCIASDAEGDVAVQLGDRPFSVSCEVHPEYPADPRRDFALCASEMPLPVAAVARLGHAEDRPKTGDAVALAGFGCQVRGGVDTTFGALSVGLARVQFDVASTHGLLVTNGASLCPGDGGGAVYGMRGDDPADRVVVAVAARSDFQQFSWSVPTVQPAFLDWAAAWSRRNGTGICGLEGDAACRPGGVAFERVTVAPQTPTARGGLLSSVFLVVRQAGESVREAVERACGPQPDGYYNLLANHYEALTGHRLSPDSRPDDAGEIEIPECGLTPPEPRIKTVMYRRGDVPWSYFEDYSRRRDWRSFTAEPSTGFAEPTSVFHTYLASLNPHVDIGGDRGLGEEVLVPLGAPAAAGPAVTAYAGDIVRLASVGETAGGPEFTTVAITPDPYIGTVLPVLHLSNVELESHDKACGQGETDPLEYPYDVLGLVETLRENVTLKGRTFHDRKVRVMVADTGLYLAERGVFPISDTTEEVLKRARPLTDTPKSNHGTRVASLVLGGPVFSQFMSLMGRKINLYVHNIFHERLQRLMQYDPPIEIRSVELKKGAFETVAQSAENHAEIVNLSLKTADERDLQTIRQHYLGANRRVLFVVAAGNLDGPLDGNEIYPAAYGGREHEGQWNLITVASLDRNGDLAKHSNSSPKYVEIGAPGCNVPVLSYDVGHDVLEMTDDASGTSLAAPLVTFTAALLHAELPHATPWIVKARLLAAADLRPGTELALQIEDGRQLNIIKALSVHRDLLQLADQEERLLKGDVVFGQQVGGEVRARTDAAQFDFCDGAVSVVAGRLLKIWSYRSKQSEARVRLYYLDRADSKHFDVADCPAPPDFRIGIGRSTRAPTYYRLEEIRDYVRRG